MSVAAASTLLSNILNNNRYYPYYVQLLVGGFDDSGPGLYSSMPWVVRQKRRRFVADRGQDPPWHTGCLKTVSQRE